MRGRKTVVFSLGFSALCLLGAPADSAKAGPGPWDNAPWYSMAYGGDLPYEHMDSYGTDADGQPLYICRAWFNGTLQVGKTRAGWGSCDVPYGGGEHWVTPYEVLAINSGVAFALEPTDIRDGEPAVEGAFPGGTDGDNATLFPCSVPYLGGRQVGKTRRDWGVCDIAYGGAEIFVPSDWYRVYVVRPR